MTYEDAAREFLTDWLYSFAPEIPDYDPPGGANRPVFPFDDFCDLNPGLLQTVANFAQFRGYELSERQLSWACMVYRAEVRSWWS